MSSSSDSLFSSLPEPLQKLIDEVFTSVANSNTFSKRRNTQKARTGGPRASSPSTAAVTGGGFIIQDTGNVPSTPPIGGGGGFILDDRSVGGGFIIDDTTSPSGGGFIPDDSSSLHAHDSDVEPDATPSQISFSLIPSALYRLDLPGDDLEILGVLRNAAGGWTSSSVPAPPSGDVDDTESGDGGGSNLYVDRADWRSVCAVLLESRADDFKSTEPEEPLRQRRHRPTRSLRATASSDVDAMEVDDVDEDVDEDEDMSDIYVDEDGLAAGSDADFRDEDDDDEFLPGSKRVATRSSKGRRRAGRDASSSPPPSAVPRKPTRRQREEALQAFGLFFTSRSNKDKAAGFEDIPKEDIANQRLKLSHLQAAATLLGEKFKAEEMVDMLEMFSTAPDKSLNLDDFTRMVMAAKLV